MWVRLYVESSVADSEALCPSGTEDMIPHPTSPKRAVAILIIKAANNHRARQCQTAKRQGACSAWKMHLSVMNNPWVIVVQIRSVVQWWGKLQCCEAKD